MWTCNICFKTFDRSTSYYNHRRSHNFNYKISSSEQKTSSDEESSEEFSSNQIFSEKDNIYIYNNNDDEGDESNDDEESYESDKVEESSKSDENEIISDNLPVPIIEHSIPTTNINEMANSTFSKNDDQTSSDSDEQNFPNEIYRDFVKLVKFRQATLAEIAKKLVFDYNEICINQEDGQERSYSEMFNCNWWKQAVNHAPYGKSSKQIKETEEFRKAIRITFHKYFEILLAPIRVQHQTGIQLKVGNSYVWYTMVVAMILGDWPENGKYCLTYGGSKYNGGLDSKLTGLYLKWNDMYRKTRKLAFTERELDDFEIRHR
ncbi:unnamed protein product [Rhizophagus irregularis]|nr:unnamed protein product [Rhizophagus irregularis]